MLTFERFETVNAQRLARWHDGDIDDWTLGDWGNALAGEAGEACNAIKKLRRMESGLVGTNKTHNNFASREEAVAAIGMELADTVTYCACIAKKLGISLGDFVALKFNIVSDRYGFEEKL